jgi:membrane-bound lytic murein transglycosylase MltF
MHPTKPYLLFLFVCLTAGALLVPVAPAQSTPPQTKAPVVAPPATTKQWTGDLDVLLKHRVIRVGVPYSKTLFYTVKGTPNGISYEMGKEFEKYLNKKYPQQNKNVKIHVLFAVSPREKALSYLNSGTVDVIIGGITITPERQKLVDFSDPLFTDVKEIVVAAPDSPKLASVDDLSGKEVFVRKTSAYWEHLEGLNEQFKKDKKSPVKLTGVPDDLGDEDILEMVNAGLLPLTVVNDWTAKLWGKLLPKMQVHFDIAIGTGVAFGWAARKNSPKLLADINEFIKTHRQGTAFGNQMVTKYTGSTYMLKQAVSAESMTRFEQTAQYFRKYSDKYGMDYLLMMAEGYQESALNQQAKSQVGAVGVLQVMPSTAKDMNVGDVTQEEPNIHAGVKYFSTTMKRLYGDETNMDDLNKVLFTFAAYNCGPARVKQLRAEAAQKRLDPNVWMNNVEFIAAARVGQETVNYVTNIYKYYVAYKLIAVQEEQRRKAKEALEKKPS